jgi:3-oxoadipate enol-lactonase
VPYVENQGTRIYWDERGRGEPLLLIMGLGSASDMWYRLLPALSARYRTIFFDNRGVGRSDAPPAPYSIELMAGDAAAVLEAASVGEPAHVMGFSMGGFIAQEFALRYTEKVRSLILASTACGGPERVMAAPEVLTALEAKDVKTREEGFWMTAPYNYHASTPRALMEEDLSVTLGYALRREGYRGQLQAITSWAGAHSRLSTLLRPTLIIHGDSDLLIPTGNAHVLAGAIPSAELCILREAGHRFMTDKTQEGCAAILSFLERAGAPTGQSVVA